MSYLAFALRYLVGPLILFLCLVMGWTSERMSRETRSDMARLAPSIVSLEAERLDPSAEGKLVFVSGPLTAPEIEDPVTGWRVAGLRLRRSSHLYQWVEHEREVTRNDPTTGRSRHDHYEYSYSQEWREQPVDSGRFHRKGHENPPTPALPEAANLTPGELHLGAYRISGERVDSLTGTPGKLPAEGPRGGYWDAPKGQFFPGQTEATARLGTVRHTYQKYDLPGQASALGLLKGDQIVAFQAPSGEHPPELRAGRMTRDEFVRADVESASFAAWFFRVGDGFGLLLGVWLVTWKRTVKLAVRLGAVVGLWLFCHVLPMLLG